MDINNNSFDMFSSRENEYRKMIEKLNFEKIINIMLQENKKNNRVKKNVLTNKKGK